MKVDEFNNIIYDMDDETGIVTVTIKLSYRSYEALLREGRLELEDMPCPR